MIEEIRTALYQHTCERCGKKEINASPTCRPPMGSNEIVVSCRVVVSCPAAEDDKQSAIIRNVCDRCRKEFEDLVERFFDPSNKDDENETD